MAKKGSVVTPERFASGFSYQDYMARVKVNQDRFKEYFDTARLSDEDVQFFRKVVQAPQGPAKMLVLGEDWCPDVYRGLPVMARISQAAGIEMLIFPRDENLDIMNEFLNQGKFMSIPVAVFYTKDHQHLGHWIERPKLANQERAEMEKALRRERPNADDREILTAVRERTQARYPAWQQETVREIRQMLAEKLGL